MDKDSAKEKLDQDDIVLDGTCIILKYLIFIIYPLF